MRRTLLTLGLVLLAGAALTGRRVLSDDSRSMQLLRNRLYWQEGLITGTQESGLKANIDYAIVAYRPEWGTTVLSTGGWALSCQSGAGGYPQAIDMTIDGDKWYAADNIAAAYNPAMITSVNFWWDRPDVRSAASGWGYLPHTSQPWTTCVPQYPGFEFWIDVQALPAGQHWVALRLWNTDNTLSAWSPSRGFTR